MANKLTSLYNLNSHKHFADSVEYNWLQNKRAFERTFADSSGGLVLPRSLQAVDPTIYEQRYPNNTFLQTGIEVNNIGGFARNITSRRTRPQGSFENVSERSDNKGSITVNADRNDIGVIDRGAGIKWSYSQLQTVALEGRNLMDELLSATNEIYMTELDEIGYLGINGNEGLLNFSGFPTIPALGLIGTLTPLQMYEEFATLIRSQKNAVQSTGAYTTTHVVMPHDVFTTIENTILDTTASNSASVLEALRSNFSSITFMWTHRQPAGASATVAFSSDRQSMQFRIPTPLTIGDIIQQSSFNYAADAMYRIAGLDVLTNESGYILTGL